MVFRQRKTSHEEDILGYHEVQAICFSRNKSGCFTMWREDYVEDTVDYHYRLCITTSTSMGR